MNDILGVCSARLRHLVQHNRPMGSASIVQIWGLNSRRHSAALAAGALTTSLAIRGTVPATCWSLTFVVLNTRTADDAEVLASCDDTASSAD
ncbi:hypothetical protein ARTHRO9AX_190147 [Arthrobacter sp. 9AX]|nr:hypothetical protein ARTHRO9AX_190147 [Arthrobacter sp. 9AX]